MPPDIPVQSTPVPADHVKNLDITFTGIFLKVDFFDVMFCSVLIGAFSLRVGALPLLLPSLVISVFRFINKCSIMLQIWGVDSFVIVLRILRFPQFDHVCRIRKYYFIFVRVHVTVKSV